MGLSWGCEGHLSLSVGFVMDFLGTMVLYIVTSLSHITNDYNLFIYMIFPTYMKDSVTPLVVAGNGPKGQRESVSCYLAHDAHDAHGSHTAHMLTCSHSPHGSHGSHDSHTHTAHTAHM